jgi:hypothetical protein
MSPVTRRQFLVRAGVLATLSQVPALLKSSGLLAQARALEGDVVRDTINGLVAFVVPGPDDYSRAQGEWSTTPGGLAADATDFLIESLDGYLPQPDPPGAANDDTVPLSSGVATLLNAVALQVNPLASAGLFLSPFARLRFSDKGEVFRRLEALDLGDAIAPQPFTAASGNLRFIAGALLEFAAFGTYTERTPVGWGLSGYPGVADGWDDFRGYWGGRRRAT